MAKVVPVAAQTPESKSLNEVNKELSNPISSIWALQLQENTYGLNKPDRKVVNLQFQPVLPLTLTDKFSSREKRRVIAEGAMLHVIENSKHFASLISAMVLGSLLIGCSQTAAPRPDIIERAKGETVAPPPPSGFLGSDYSLLTPPADASDQKAMLRYINPNAPWSTYTKIMVAPVTFWAADDSKVSAADQQALCNYAYGVFVKDLGKNFIIVDQPGPGVMKLSIALTDATSAVPGLRSISVVVPQARALSTIKMAATGTYLFVGSAEGAAKLNDSVSGNLLAAWSDKRVGGTSITNVTVFQWGDAQNAIDYWADGLNKRLRTLGVQHSGGAVTVNK